MSRTATLVAIDQSSVLTLLKEPFLNTIGDVIRSHNLSLIEKLKNLELFKNWSLAQLASLYRHFTKKAVGFNSFIYRKGDKDDNIYMVVKGEVEVFFYNQILAQVNPIVKNTQSVKLMTNNRTEKKPPQIVKAINPDKKAGTWELLRRRRGLY